MKTKDHGYFFSGKKRLHNRSNWIFPHTGSIHQVWPLLVCVLGNFSVKGCNSIKWQRFGLHVANCCDLKIEFAISEIVVSKLLQTSSRFKLFYPTVNDLLQYSNPIIEDPGYIKRSLGSQAEGIEAMRKHSSSVRANERAGELLFTANQFHDPVATVHKNTSKYITANRSPPLIAVLRSLRESSHQIELPFQLSFGFVYFYLYVIGKESKSAFLCADGKERVP